MIIIGIDPGLAKLGYGVLKKPEAKNGRLEALDYGCIITDPKLSPGERLKQINNGVNKLISKYKPGMMAVESLYFFKNAKTALPVSQAKGVVLLTAAKKGVPIYEFTPLQAKMTMTGYGKADKKQVQQMTKILLNLENTPKPDHAADALAIAICGARNQRGVDKLL